MKNGCTDNWEVVITSTLEEIEFATTPVLLESAEIGCLLALVEREVNLNLCPSVFYGRVRVV